MAIRKEDKKVQDNMNYKTDKEEMLVAKLNKVEQRVYDNLKKGEELNMLDDKQKEQLKKLGMDIIDNMGYQAQKEKNMEMAGGIKFKDLKNLKGSTLAEKLKNLGVRNVPKNITLQKAIELINKKRAN